MHAYPASVEGCTTQGGLADAYRPITTLGYGLPDWAGCDVFSVRYPVMVNNIARFLGNLRVGSRYFNGHVIFMTTPAYAPTATRPRNQTRCRRPKCLSCATASRT